MDYLKKHSNNSHYKFYSEGPFFNTYLIPEQNQDKLIADEDFH